jgi:single-strand DNA-binding protein
MSVNKVTLIGNLTADPAIKTFDNGGKMATFGVATSDKGFKSKTGVDVPERTEYHNIVIQDKLADVAEKYLRKGNKVYLEGKIRYRNYTDTEGVKRYVTDIHVLSMELITPKPATQTAAPFETKKQDEDDLPF